MIARCHHCQTDIVDYSSVVDLAGEMYCCRNCLVAVRGGARAMVPDVPLCDHCDCPLVEPDSLVERHAQRFCCYNCATADIHAVRPLAA
jgi:hypothetical protein